MTIKFNVAIIALAAVACGGGGENGVPSPESAPAPSPAPTPVTGVPQESAMPAWRQGQAVGEWRQISGSALAAAPRAVIVDGNTGPQSKVIAWASFIIDTRDSSLYSVANGGHHDYAGNEGNRIGLFDGAPRWTERRASTPMAQIGEDVSYYADGRPTSRHTYYGAVMNEVGNRAMVFGGGMWGNGNALSTMDGFNLSSNDWDAAGAIRTHRRSTPSPLATPSPSTRPSGTSMCSATLP